MATYKQKLPRFHITRDSDSEESEQEWVKFSTSDKPIERRLVNNVSDEEDWHVLSESSAVEESIPSFESNSEVASGYSDYDSESYFAQDENVRSIVLPEGQDNSSFVRKMPSHDGTGNFFDTALSDGSNYDSSTSLMDSDLALRRHVGAKIDHIESTASSYLDQSNEPLSNDLRGSIISDKASLDARHTIPIGRRVRSSIRESWMNKFRNVFRIEEEVVSTPNSQEQITQASQQIYHKFAESASSAAKFELGDLGNTNPIKSLADIGNENVNPITHTTRHSSNVGSCIEKNASIITRFGNRGNRLAVPKDPLAISFAPTISKDMLNEMMSAENVNNTDHQNEQSASSQISSQPDKYSIFSTVWTTVCRITNNIIVSDDIDPVPNDPTNLTFASSNHNTHGLASIIWENNYDTIYPPFGNHLSLSELFPSLHNYKSHYSSSSTPSTSSYNKRRNSVTSSNTKNILITPVSSSTSLKSFRSRSGSDCGLECGRCISSTTLEAPLVL